MANWKIQKGSLPVLLVAAHAQKHTREDRVKPADLNTDVLAKELADTTGSWFITTTSIQQDPNWYLKSPFRVKVKKIIQERDIETVFDIHGRKKEHPNLLEFLPNNSFSQKYHSLLKSTNIPILPFSDNEQVTLAEDLDRDGVPCIEVETRIKTGKDGKIQDSDEYQRIIDTLTKLIKKTTH